MGLSSSADVSFVTLSVPCPPDLADTLQWQGETIVLRPIRAEDEAQHRAFVERLQPDDLRMRFFHARHGLPPSELERLTHIDYGHEMAFVAVRGTGDGGEETLGVVRAVGDGQI